MKVLTLRVFSFLAIWCLCELPSFGLTIQPSPRRTIRRLNFVRRFRRNHNHPPIAVLKGDDTSNSNLLYSSETLPHLNSNTYDDDSESTSRKNTLGMSVALFSTYFAVISAKCALPSAFALLTSPTSGLSFASSSVSLSSTASSAASTATQIGQQSLARLLTLSTLSIAMGKFFLGPVIDSLGGIRSLKISLTSLSLLLAVISTTSSFQIFSMAWLVVDFIFSSCWAACLNAVHQSFPPNMWTEKVGMLASAARSGNTFAFATFAVILNSSFMKQIMNQVLSIFSVGGSNLAKQFDPSWRTVFFVSSLLQLIPITLLSMFGKNVVKPSSKIRMPMEPAGGESTLKILKKQLQTPLFWLHLTSRTALMIFGSFLLFVPTFMTHGFQMNNSQAAQVGSIFSLGCLLSLVFGSKKYNKLQSKEQRFLSIISMLAVSTLCAIGQWLHVSPSFAGISLSPLMGTVLMFLWGCSFAIPFYLPPSLYALEKGGKMSSATIADVFDIAGFALLAPFNGYVAGIQHNILGAWSTTFLTLIVCSSISLVSLGAAILLDE